MIPAWADLVNRWSFNETAGPAANGTTFIDSLHGAQAVLRGNGGILTGTAIELPGTASALAPLDQVSAYLDLPNGIVSSKTNLTIEIWATSFQDTQYERVFDFGRTDDSGDGWGADGEWTGTHDAWPQDYGIGRSYLYMVFPIGAGINSQQAGFRLNAAAGADIILWGAADLGRQFHYVLTLTDGAGVYGVNGSQLAWYRDGQLAGVDDVPFHLRDLPDVNNWLGRSNYNGNQNAHAAYNEVRIYDHTFTPAEVTASFDAGPDAPFFAPPPVANADTATMHHGQKVLLPVLANDTGLIDPASLTVTQAPQFGTAVPDGRGSILYTHTTGTPASDSFTYQIANYTGTHVSQAVVPIQFATSLRIPNSQLNVPSSPPPTALQVVPAFPGLFFHDAVAIASFPGDTRRLLVAERGGWLQLIPELTAPAPAKSVFLDLPAMLAARDQGESIQDGPYGSFGLLGVAVHPNFGENGFFYILYMATIDGVAYERLSRFGVQAQNPDAADPDSEQILLQQVVRDGSHTGGDLHFGPDGYLYVSVGDEGPQYDGLHNSQHIDRNFFSGLLRIDVDKKPGSLPPNPNPALLLDDGVARYAIPPDNPFVGATQFNGLPVEPTNVRTEFWAVGLRNPWRFSFDSMTGDLWLGDVGQDFYEEINLITRGGNYGWVFRDADHPGYPGERTVPAGFTPLDPLYHYEHTGLGADSNLAGNSVTGGVVYRGARIPSLVGAYIFADYVTGNIWSLRHENGGVQVERIAGQGNIAALGTDPSNGDVLLVGYGANTIFRLTNDMPSGNEYPQTLSATRLFADLSDLLPSPGLLPYAPNLSFWSDYAIKRRWFILPGASSQLTWSSEGPWGLPDGAIFVKHFEMELIRGDPNTRKRIETRVLVKNATGVYGVSYRWNEAQTEAELVPDGGADLPLEITDYGITRTQTWHIPSRTECAICHNAAAGYALSFNTRQLNQQNNILGFSGNQLTLLSQHGLLDGFQGSPNFMPRHVRPDETAYSVEARARSYLAVNCSTCHRDEGVAPPSFDARAAISLAATGLINGTALNNGGTADNKLVVPGDSPHSIVLNRVALTNGFTRMPPIGSNELDQTGIALLTEWIEQSLPARQTYDQWRQAWFQSTTSPEGEPTADPEADGQTNRDEFLAGTNPRSGSSFLSPKVVVQGSSAALNFDLAANRVVQIETSTDLTHWSLWDTPANNTIPLSGGSVTLFGPMTGPQQFFRMRVWETEE